MEETLTESEIKEKIAKCKDMAERSITKYMVIAILGAFFLTLGIVFIVVGSVILGTASKEQYEGLGIAFVVMGPIMLLGPGLGMSIPGIALWISVGVQINVARKTLRKYQTKLDIANEEKNI